MNEEPYQVMGPLLGEQAPNFVLDTTRERAALGAMLQGGKVLLAFFKDPYSPHCRSLLGLLQDFQRQFSAAGVSVLAASPNSIDTLRTLASELNLDYPLASDPKLTLARAYGVAHDSAREPHRSVFVIDPDGLVVLSIDNYHPANISQLEAIFLALELVEESPPVLQRDDVDGLWQRALRWL